MVNQQRNPYAWRSSQSLFGLHTHVYQILHSAGTVPKA
jgi:hypothetical protein